MAGCKYTSSLTKTGANVEAVSWGTAPATYVWFGKVQTNNIKLSNVTQLNRTQNLSRETDSIDVLQRKYDGPFSWRVQDASFFLAAFGTLNTTGGPVYNHTFTTGDSLVSYSMYHEKKGRGTQLDIIEETVGCRTNEFKLSCAEGGYLEATNTITAKDRSPVAAKVFAASTTVPFRFSDIVDGTITIDGNDVKITSWEYTRNNTLSDEQSGELIDEQCPQELVENITIGYNLKGPNVRTPFIAGTEVPLVIEWVRGADTLTVTAQVTFSENPEDTGVEGPIAVSATAMVRTTTVVSVDANATYTF